MAAVRATWYDVPLPTDSDRKVINKITILRSQYAVVWTPLTETDTVGIAEPLALSPGRSVHVFGTFNGATVVLQGSNDIVNVKLDLLNGTSAADWRTIRNIGGTVLSFTSADLQEILENSAFVRPSISGAGASTQLTVAIVGNCT